jgi:galactose mutarotase-like enzyme
VGDVKYDIPIHGFARFIDFEVEKPSEKKILFRTTHSFDTLEQYPFHFDLRIGYELKGKKIVKSHRLENTGANDMYYEIGGHEGYNLTLLPGEKMEDYFITFPGMEEIETYTSDEDMMVNKGKKTIALDDGRLFLSPEVFKNDALIIDNFKERRVILENLKNDRKAEVKFKDFKYLGIWTKYMRADYVCIEPWSSLPDCNYLGSELQFKKDVRKLEPGEWENLEYEIAIR